MSLALKVEDLIVRGDGTRTILSVPAFAMAPGETVGLAGPSGAGKSTFLLAIAGLARWASGSVAWGGTDILRLSSAGRAKFRRDTLGLIFQDYPLFDELSASANAAVVADFSPRSVRPAIEAAACESLSRFAVPADRQRSVATFSGGERQRVAVARALAASPSVLLADEPTANLDGATAERLADDLMSLATQRSMTVLAVSHDDALLSRLSRVVRVRDGTVAP